jgi:hypothetical protein
MENGNRSGSCAEASGKSDPFLSLTRGSTLDNSETNSPPQVPTTDAGPGPPPNPNTEAVAKTKTKARLTGEASATTATAATAMEEEGEERPRARVDLRLVGDYELQKLVGKGSFARVFRA